MCSAEVVLRSGAEDDRRRVYRVFVVHHRHLIHVFVLTTPQHLPSVELMVKIGERASLQCLEMFHLTHVLQHGPLILFHQLLMVLQARPRRVSATTFLYPCASAAAAVSGSVARKIVRRARAGYAACRRVCASTFAATRRCGAMPRAVTSRPDLTVPNVHFMLRMLHFCAVRSRGAAAGGRPLLFNTNPIRKP